MANADTPALDLECHNLTKTFGDFLAVDDVSFSVPSGAFFSILGPSGCGKTTLLRMLAGFLEPTSGDIAIKGQSMLGVAPNKRPVNMVFQHLALFPMMTVGENIAYGLKRRGTPKREIPTLVRDALERVNLPDAIDKKIDQLSGGQKQRIAIARCMVLNPAVLLLDEPLGALDLKLREHMKIELKQLQSQFGTTFMYITHDQSEALVMSDQVAIMNKGRFEQIGTPQELYYHPKTAFVAGFVGDSDRWRGAVESADGTGVRVSTKDGISLLATPAGGMALSVGQQVDIFVRPEAVIISQESARIQDLENRLNGTVVNLLFNGANSRALVRDEKTGGELTVALPQTGEFSTLRRGQTVYLGWMHDKALAFAVSGEDQP
ncbi:spermidine/putrescine transport system ATP-binding protein [Varunaivibrio sulfuroxidans]|uniref:Spermidine/putrescine transport system ATP-binding protein n=2 Tax=Varunaivibrio sulfuroxidans TaxID=1773489 RepID=A0A4R3JEB5_9PROT|nr:spermidine/putrescine transport system ATP-binding protein [Varunaivibrio sulfuroxidans]